MTQSATVVALLASLAVVLVAGFAARVLVAPRHVIAPTDRAASWWRTLTQRRRTPPPPTDSEMAAWCDQVAAALRSGRSLTAAITETDAAWRPRAVLPSVGQSIRRGRALGDAFTDAPADPATPRGLTVPVLTAQRAARRPGGSGDRARRRHASCPRCGTGGAPRCKCPSAALRSRAHRPSVRCAGVPGADRAVRARRRVVSPRLDVPDARCRSERHRLGLDATSDRSPAMNAMSAAGGCASTTAVVAGVLVFGVIFMLAAAARGSPARRPPPVERRHSSRTGWRRWAVDRDRDRRRPDARRGRRAAGAGRHRRRGPRRDAVAPEGIGRSSSTRDR